MDLMTSLQPFRNTRVLVTGLTGFKGQWIGRWLERCGAKVVGLGLAPQLDPMGNRTDVSAVFDCRTMDIRNLDGVRSLVSEFRPEIVFHLAAQPLVRLSYASPVETFATNVLGTVHALEAARNSRSVQAFVNVTSDKCYENREWHWAYRENEPMGGHDPYSASKGCAELVTAAYRSSFSNEGLNIATARAGNVIGGADWAEDRLVPDIVRSIISKQPVILRRPQAIRPWQHVLEAISGYMTLGAKLLTEGTSYAAAWNFGPSDSDNVCVGELARQIVQRWGQGHVIEDADLSGPHEARYLKLDSSKARAELNWEAILSSDDRIHWTVEWYRKWVESPSQYWQLMDDQIDRFEKRWQSWLDRKRSLSPGSPALSAHRSHAA